MQGSVKYVPQIPPRSPLEKLNPHPPHPAPALAFPIGDDCCSGEIVYNLTSRYTAQQLLPLGITVGLGTGGDRSTNRRAFVTRTRCADLVHLHQAARPNRRRPHLPGLAKALASSLISFEEVHDANGRTPEAPRDLLDWQQPQTGLMLPAGTPFCGTLGPRSGVHLGVGYSKPCSHRRRWPRERKGCWPAEHSAAARIYPRSASVSDQVRCMPWRSFRVGSSRAHQLLSRPG